MSREHKRWATVRPSHSWVRLALLLFVLFLTNVCSLSQSEARDGDCESAEACFQRAASFADEQPDQVALLVERFRHVQEAYPGTLWARRAGFRIGWALLEREPDRAIDYLRGARKDFPVLEDYVLLKLGQALGRVGSFHESALAFEASLESSASSALRNDTSYEAGFAWFENGQCQPAIAYLEQATARDPDSPSAPRALSLLADCAGRLQEVNLAQHALGELWRRHPESPEAQAMERAAQSGQANARLWEPSSEDYYERGRTWYYSARFEAAIRDLQKFLAGQPHGPNYEQGFFRLGMAHVRLKQYPQAADVFRRLLENPSEYAGKAAVWLAKVYLRRDQGQRLLKFRDSVPPGLNVDDQARIQWLSGVWAEGERAIQQAARAYEEAYRTADRSKIKRDALWRLGWLHYQQGGWEDAVEAFDSLARTGPGRHWQNRAHYWKARALECMGRGDEAQTVYGQVAAEWPMTYYGQLSESRLRHPRPAGRQPREEPTNPVMNGPASSAFRINAHFQKATELSKLGLRQEALEELLVVKRQYRDQPQALYALARHMLELGDFEAPIVIAKRYFREPLERRRISLDSPLWRMAYPTGYMPQIRRHAASHVDPFLVAGIIREESLYNPKALSPVGAMGLMQLMPKTANRTARRLGLVPVDREDLLQGEMNVRLGVAYVGQLLRDYQGNLIRAVAAYNAGPTAVKRWIAKFGNRDPDEFVELISYRETRRYVKRVLTSYRIYQTLYSTTCSAIPLDRAC
ncbi:MAG: transglycosylase SLT domain-containing protein [Nitrospira sp. SB0666_bin_27]|nr:transglycosylase SLT domain-containing protein [Nitrospira sp. SB0666_bin_27]